MKKLINNQENVVNDMVEGIIAAFPQYLKKLAGYNVLVRSNSSEEKVAVISGGGSGHEPAHAGYVGYGMLDGAVCGEVFTSPTPDAIYEAIKTVNKGRGVLLVIKNYTGDLMNFQMAKELAEMDGITVEEVIVNDDVAVENSLYTAGRRGIAGTIFVHKIAGAKAEEGGSLAEVKRVAQKTINNVRTMGMALSSCIIPAVGKANFTLGEDEVEIGMGIHGEPGTHREKISTADEIAAKLVNKILEDMEMKNGEECAVIINGLGSTPNMELYVVNKKVNEMLKEKGISIYRTFIGEYMTSLEMAGCSITILKLDDELKHLLGAKADTPALKVL